MMKPLNPRRDSFVDPQKRARVLEEVYETAKCLREYFTKQRLADVFEEKHGIILRTRLLEGGYSSADALLLGSGRFTSAVINAQPHYLALEPSEFKIGNSMQSKAYKKKNKRPKVNSIHRQYYDRVQNKFPEFTGQATVPNEGKNSDTITPRGDPSKLGEALALVYPRGSSVITQQIVAPTWLHKHIIGPKGSTLQSLIPNREKVQIDFEDTGNILLEGAPEEVKTAHAILSAEVARLQKEISIEKVELHPTLRTHIISRGGALILKIKDETGVQISIPSEQTNSDGTTVEGKKEGVKKAVEEIQAIASKIEHEKSRDIIIELGLHELITGTKGENIGKIRDAHPKLVLSFPDVSKKSDVINIHGDKTEVGKVYKQLHSMAKELVDSFSFFGANASDVKS